MNTMKLLLLSTLMLSFSANAATLKCTDPGMGAGFNTSSAIVSNTELLCIDQDTDEEYYARIDGVEPGIGFGAKEYKMRCLGDSPVGDYVGLEVDVCLFVGGHCGVQIGTGGACIISGFQAGVKINAPLSAARTKIRRVEDVDRDEFFK